MAKKIAAERQEKPSSRKGTKTGDDIRGYAAMFEARVGELLAHADAIDSLTEKAIEFDGIKKADWSLERLDEYLTSIGGAITAAKKRQERGG